MTPTEEFLQEFSFSLALDQMSKERVYRLRHKVYCEELEYEPSNKVDKTESDHFDAFSLHCLVEHRKSGLEAGCIRIIAPTNEARSITLPFETRFKNLFLEDKAALYGLERQNICEISRTAIPSMFRIPKYTATREGRLFTMEQMKHFPLIRLGLFVSVVAMAEVKNRMHGYAVMEHAMPRMLKSAGFSFYRISRDIEFNGRRAVYYNNRDETIASLPQSILPIYYHLRNAFGLEYK
ncbi:PEP-CTERM/exosortase system-associated acyltransferase [Kushneria sp. TE3]|uniref:PEP-CTERM/exosortase system-associated acyltransferase n=1 Tax=Kushneria sp. TE3 TaxID=3449832 RepID=UPI003F683FF4